MEERSFEDNPKEKKKIHTQEEVIVGEGEKEENFSSPTPAKAKEPSRVKKIEELAELPEKHGLLVEFFNRMTTSLRLLGLLKMEPTFGNVSRQVEKLTGRKFQLMHLAQIKYILPEAVHIDKILLHDVKTKCMKSHLKIELTFEVVKGHNEQSDFLALSDLFFSRLKDFYIKHHEDCDVPEAALPKQFNQESTKILEDSLSKEIQTSTVGEMLNSSHLPPTFKRHFNHKPVSSETKTDLLSPIKSVSVVNEDIEQLTSLPDSTTISTSKITPSKQLSGNTSVMVDTLVQSTPMRLISPSSLVLTCEDEKKNTAVIGQSSKNHTSSAKKSLDFNSEEPEDDVFSRKQVSACLTDLVRLIHNIFQSVNFRAVTKEELVQKIIMNNFEFDDNSEVETQVGHIEKLVPDWLSKKFAPSGDILYNVKKISDLDAVCERISIV